MTTKLSHLLIAIGIAMTAWLLSPAIVRADTPITITTVITEVYAEDIYMSGLSHAGSFPADWTPVHSDRMVGLPDNDFGGFLKEAYTGNHPDDNTYKLIVDFGDDYEGGGVVSALAYGTMTTRDQSSRYCDDSDCWQTPDSENWSLASSAWYTPTGTPAWGIIRANIPAEASTRYWYFEVDDNFFDSAGAFMYMDAIRMTLATPVTKTSVITIPDCPLITNYDFISGTTGWTATNVITAPSEVVFDAGGQVAQSVATTYTNAITNPGFEVNLSGWAESDASNCLTASRSTSEAHSGAGSLLLQRSCDVSRYYYSSNLTTTNTIYTFGAWVKTTGKYKLAVRQTDNTTYSFTPVRTGSGDWEFVTVTAPAKSGTNKVLAYIYFDAQTSGTEPVYVDDTMLVSGSSIPTSATVHWIGRSTSIHPVNATVSVGAESASRQFTGLRQEFYDTISGDFAGNYDVTVNADQDFALDYLCISLSGSGGTTGEECYTVDDASFEDGEPWTLTAATVSGGALTLSAGGSAAQSVSLSSGMQYTVVMSAAFAQAGDLSITLGDHTEEITVPIAASLSYQQAFDVTSGAQLELSSTSGGVSVEYICYNEQTRSYGECLPVIPNGEFDANTDWQYRNGAVWNNVAANAFVPAISGGTFGNIGLGAVGQYPLQGMLPDLLPGEFLILQFDARSIDNGIVTARIRDVDLANQVSITYTAVTKNQYTRYQVPVSELAGHNGAYMDVGFFNTGLLTSTTGTTATDISIFVDNVCLYLSNEEPQLPVTNPIYGGYNGALPFTCGTVSEWLYELTGINFPELETMEPPSAWEFSSWVPWLAGRLWVNIGKPMACLLVSLFNSSPFMSIINAFNWAISTVSGAISWLAGWFFSLLGNIMTLANGFVNLWKILWWDISNIIKWASDNSTNVATWVWQMVMAVMDIILGWFGWFRDLLLSLFNYFIYMLESVANWFLWLWNSLFTVLLWLADALKNSMGSPWAMFTDIMSWIWELVTEMLNWAWGAAIAALEWTWDAISQFPGWLWDTVIAAIRWLSGSVIAALTAILNAIIGAWNLILPGLRSFFEFLLNLLVDFWNWLSPMFGSMSGIFDTIWDLLVAVGENVIGIATGLWQTLTTLGAIMFENFGETIGLPMSFYTAFDNAVSSEPFVFIPTCSAGGELWCNFIFGIQLVNQIAGQSIMYPLVIVLIIILTVIVIQRHIWETIKPPGFR